jgi:hypothetical protein
VIPDERLIVSLAAFGQAHRYWQSARALGVYALLRGPTSHTVIDMLPPQHVVRPLSAPHHARALVDPIKHAIFGPKTWQKGFQVFLRCL